MKLLSCFVTSKRIFACFFIAVIVSTSLGCISGDGNITANDWNSGVERVNGSLKDGNAHKDDVNSNLLGQDYDSALDSIGLAILSYSMAIHDMGDLGDHTGGEAFLEEYLEAWEEQVKEMINSLSYLDTIIQIDMFNVGFYNISSLHPSAEAQLAQAFSYYYDGDHSASMTALGSSRNKYGAMRELSSEMLTIAQAINEDFVIDYTLGIYDLYGHAIGALDDLELALQYAGEGNMASSVQMMDSANGKYSMYVEKIDYLISIETMHPNAFPSHGYALQELQDAYTALKESSEDLSREYGLDMEEIENGHLEFFEK